MKRPVVVYGPQGCGKTRNAQLLSKAFQRPVIVDEWNGKDPLTADALALTNIEGADITRGLPQNLVLVSYNYAKEVTEAILGEELL